MFSFAITEVWVGFLERVLGGDKQHLGGGWPCVRCREQCRWVNGSGFVGDVNLRFWILASILLSSPLYSSGLAC